jgi:hypothetical protein
MHDLGIYIAIRAINEYANSALPNAPLRPDPPKRRTLRRLIAAAARYVYGMRPSTASARTVGRIPSVRRPADRPAPGDWPGRGTWQAPSTNPTSTPSANADPSPLSSPGAKSTVDVPS